MGRYLLVNNNLGLNKRNTNLNSFEKIVRKFMRKRTHLFAVYAKSPY